MFWSQCDVIQVVDTYYVLLNVLFIVHCFFARTEFCQ